MKFIGFSVDTKDKIRYRPSPKKTVFIARHGAGAMKDENHPPSQRNAYRGMVDLYKRWKNIIKFQLPRKFTYF